ncbi:hypothetical protein P775_23915 [Puniceibacterium antarcticum]|uniref:VWFA domain-containing protein n=1 Tax=Puniceibacterium antarcticum TaxID=1206336 RepID=A0A2G8R7W2_9RHOB|nr:DUF1194 domain-containing protein [Puniceibacterium antarcticum]PIL17627.1 hypothetical protein P775_23915 [Puniceibacterium antarcticum]
MLRAACLVTLLWAGPALAQSTDACRLALVLALDVSSSVSEEEHRLQRDGLAAALSDTDIRSAILQGTPMALSIYEWSGRQKSVTLLDWTLLRGEAEIDRAITTLRRAPRSESHFPTAMGFALGYGATLLERGPDCTRRVIDVSGDGVSNDGFGPELAYKHFDFDGVTVNGLAVLGADPQVQEYFRDVVRHGPGAFVEISDGYAGYRRAMTRKLFREINDMVIGSRAQHHPETRG